MRGEQPAQIASRQVGEAIVTVISDGILRTAPMIAWLGQPEAEARRAMPEANAKGEMEAGMNLVHVRLGQASVLLDPGWGELDPSSWLVTDVGAERSPGVQAALLDQGIQAEDITHVLISHAHADHYTGATVERAGAQMPRYPRARYLLGRADWEGNPERAIEGSEPVTHLGALDQFGLLDLVDGDYEVVPGITMMHAPGESPGHSIMRVRSAGSTFFYLGDLFHHPCEVERPDWILFERTDEERRASEASRSRLLAEAADTDAVLIFTHGPFPGWGRVARTASGYQWRYEMPAHH
jgi:glyoxylase-like metal-dependent hydrolase (beta-lactamase superfamily II)